MKAAIIDKNIEHKISLTFSLSLNL